MKTTTSKKSTSTKQPKTIFVAEPQKPVFADPKQEAQRVFAMRSLNQSWSFNRWGKTPICANWSEVTKDEVKAKLNDRSLFRMYVNDGAELQVIFYVPVSETNRIPTELVRYRFTKATW